MHDRVTNVDSIAVNNISESNAHEAEGVIVVDPTNPDRVFAATVSVSESGQDLLKSYSTDGGVTWNTSQVGGSDGLPAACCHPAATFDQFGNLFFFYRDKAENNIHATRSTDGGQTFPFEAVIAGADYPSIVTGPGSDGAPASIWTAHEAAGTGSAPSIVVTGAPVFQLDDVGSLQEFVLDDDGVSRHFPEIAIGPQGQVLVSYASNLGGAGDAAFYAHLDPDGLGPLPFGPAIQITETSIFPRLSLEIPGHGSREITAGMNLAWDQKRGEFGRLYMTFTDRSASNSLDTDIFLVYSDDSGETWTGGLVFSVAADQATLLDIGVISNDLQDAFVNNGLALSEVASVEPIADQLWKIVDGDRRFLVRFNAAEDRLDVERERIPIGASAAAHQFQPSIAVDPSTGNLAVGWYSTLGDDSNSTTVFRLAVSSDGGRSFSNPMTVSPGRSDATYPTMSDNARAFQYGDYARIAFVDGIVQPIWADNSSKLPDNPRNAHFEIANARVGIANIGGVPPIVKANTLTMTEGSEVTETVATFSDPDPDGEGPSDYLALIDWGDGHESIGMVELDEPGYRVTGTHEYVEKGTYETTVAITNLTAPYSPPTVAMGIANVDDATLTPINHSLHVIKNVAFTETIAFFTDDNSHSNPTDFTATIQWGDNTTNTVAAIDFIGTADGSNLYAVLGSHSYADEQTYTTTVTITETGGATIVASGQIVAGDPPISVVPQGQTPYLIKALEDIFSHFGPANGPTGNLPLFDAPLLNGPTVAGDSGLAQFEVLGTVDTYDGAYTAEIDWDDGTSTYPADITLQDNIFTVTGQHAFQQGGTLFPTVTLFDDSGGSATATLVAHVGRNVTSDVTASSSGLTFNPSTNLFHGNLSVVNTSNANLTGPFLIVFSGLPPDVDLANKNGVTDDGDPYLVSNQALLFVGQSLPPLPVQFAASAQSAVTYTAKTYAEVPDLFSSAAAAASATFAKAPDIASGVSFESNQGQTDEQVDFLAAGQSYTIFLTPQEAVIRLNADLESNTGSSASSVVRMRWVDAQPDPIVVGLGQQPGASHYLIGSDPADWQTGIERFSSVRYHDIYTGIDLVYYGNQGELEYDWIVDPRSDPNQIVVDFHGADELTLDDAGRLVLQIGDQQLVLQQPVMYQTVGNDRVPVSGGYRLLDENRVGFDVGTYDASSTLIIDPVLDYSSYLGGQSSDEGTGIDVDAEGNTYVTGFTSSLNFPTLNAVQSNPFGIVAFVTKLDPTGLPVYSSYLGGLGTTRGYGVAVDMDGHAYVVGETCSVDFPTVNAVQPTPGHPTCLEDGLLQGDGFVTKFAIDGSNLEYSSFLGGSLFDVAFDVAVDSLGSAYVTGRTASVDFPTSDQSLQPSYAGLDDGFVTKLAPDGSALQYSTYLGGSMRDLPLAIAVDAAGNAYLAGRTQSNDFPSVAAFVNDYLGSEDAFVTKINPDGSVIAYSSFLGGSDEDLGLGIAVDAVGNAFVTGVTRSSDFSTLDPFQSTNRGGTDAFVVKLDPLGAGVFATYLGGSDDDQANAIAIGPDGNILIAGRTSSLDFPLRDSVQSLHRGGQFDGFVTAFRGDGQALAYSTYLGGSGRDELSDIAVDAAGDAHLVGVTESVDLRTVNASQSSIASVCQSSLDCSTVAPDAFVAKIAHQGSGKISIFNQTVAATEGVEFTNVVAVFSDTDSDTADDYMATIDWADGSTSQGSISGNGNGSFEIRGSHTYDRFGTYAVKTTLFDHDGSTVHPTQSGDDYEGPRQYQVTIDTSELSGSPGFIRVQFNPAMSPPDRGAVVQLTDFDSDGVFSGDPEYVGGAQGSLLSVVSLRNESLLNQFTQAIQFGSLVTFDVLISDDAVFGMNSHMLGNRFSVQLFDADATTPQLTTDSSGAVVSIDLNSDRSVSARVYPDANGRVAASTILINDVVVGDAPFEAEDVAIVAREGEEFSGIVARFSDSNTLTIPQDFVATVDWGDGVMSSAEIVPQGSGQFAVLGTHTYIKFGDYPLRVLIESLGGRSATAFGAASEVFDIHAARPTVVGSGSTALITDVNRDGIPDAVVAELFSSDQISVFLGRGDTTFGAPVTFPSGLIPSAIARGRLRQRRTTGCRRGRHRGPGTSRTSSSRQCNVWPTDSGRPDRRCPGIVCDR